MLIPSLSLKTKITSLVMLIFISTISGLAYFISRNLEQKIAEQIQEDQFSTVSYMARTIENAVNYRLNALSLFAAEITPAMLNEPEKIGKTLKQKTLLTTLFQAGVVAITNDGHGIADYPPLPDRKEASYTDQEYFQDVVATNKPVVGKPYMDRFSKKPVIGFAVPIFDGNGQRVAVLVGFSELSDPAFLGSIERSTHPDFQDWLLVVSPRHQICVIASDLTRILQPIAKSGLNSLFDRYMAGYEGSGIAVNTHGIELLMSAKVIPTPSWFIRIAIPTDIAFAPIREIQNIVYAMAVGLSLLISIIVWLTINRILRPLYAAKLMITQMSTPDAELVSLPVSRMDEVGQLLSSFNTHIHARQIDEARIRRMSNLNKALSTINKAIVHQKNEGELLQVACQTVVEFGEMTMAWIGRLEPDTQRIEPIAQYGQGTGYLKNITFSARADIPEGCGPAGTALRENRPVVIQNFLESEMTQPWGQRNKEYGWKSVAGFPIPRNGKPYAVLTVYHPSQDIFDQVTIDLISEIAGDISFALENLERERHRQALGKYLDYTQQRLKHIINLSPALIYALKPEPFAEGGFKISFISEMALALTGYNLVQWFEPHFWISHIHPDDRAAVMIDQQKLLTEGHLEHQYRFEHADGHYCWVDDQLVVQRDDNGAITEIIGIWLDISERKAAEMNLRLAANVFEQSMDGIIISDKNNKIISVNRAFTEMTGYTNEELLGKNPRILSSGKQDAAFYQTLWETLAATDHWQGEIWNRRKNGELFSEWLSITAVKDEQGNITQYIGVSSDLSSHKKLEERVIELSRYDPVTGLPNLLFFDDLLALAIDDARREHAMIAVVRMDIANFHTIDDQFGFEGGDRVLKAIAERLMTTASSNCILTRMAKDNFTVAENSG